MRWSKAERSLSDGVFPHRIMLKDTVFKSTLGSFNVRGAAVVGPIPMLSPKSDVMVWLHESIGHSAKPPSTMINFYNRVGVVIKHDEMGAWMVKTQGRDGYKFYFRNACDAIAFKWMFTEKYGWAHLG